MKNKAFNSFHLKLIAIVTMTIDHTALFLSMNYLPISHPLIVALRIVGRMALPLFAFLLSQAIKHTSSKKRYILQLGIMFIVLSIIFVIINLIGYKEYTTQILQSGNIFLDLLLGAITLTLLDSKGKKKMFAIIPFVFTILTYVIVQYEKSNFTFIKQLPYFLRPQYFWYFQILVIGFYYAKDIAKRVLNKQQINVTYFEDSSLLQKGENEVSAIILVVSTLFLYLITSVFNLYSNGFELYAMIPALFILFYNGKRGYYKKWFKIFSYIYYPLHIGILAIIFMIIK